MAGQEQSALPSMPIRKVHQVGNVCVVTDDHASAVISFEFTAQRSGLNEDMASVGLVECGMRDFWLNSRKLLAI